MKGELARRPLTLQDWQKAIVLNLFGWMRPNGSRRYREALLFIPRKNGKSLLTAAIGLYLFFCDREAGAEIYCAAAEKEQASLVWNMAKQQVLYEPELARRCKIYPSFKSLENPRDGSYFKPLSREALSKHGFNAHAVLFDELHTQPNGDMVEVLETSMGSRRQPLMMYLTTSDFERPNSICNDKHDYASKVRDGIVQDVSFLPVIYEARIEDDWTDPAIWAKANPNLGVSVFLEYMERKCKRAEELPAYQNGFKRLHLNIRTRSETKWVPMQHWKQCAGDIELMEKLKGELCFAGLDLASNSDLCALVMFFPRYMAALCRFWVPLESAQERYDRNRTPYLQWIDEGWITATDGNTTDYDEIRRDINLENETYNIEQIAIDRWNSTQLQTQLDGDGFDVMPYGQGFASMSAPTKELERLILRHELQHFNNPVLTWCADNVMVKSDPAGNLKPDKEKSTEKIDGMVSLIMGLGAAMLAGGVDAGSSVYDERGITFLGDEADD